MREESSSFKVFQGVILQHTGKTNLEHNTLWEKQLRIHFTAANMKNYYQVTHYHTCIFLPAKCLTNISLVQGLTPYDAEEPGNVPEAMKYWVGIWQVQSYLIGRRCVFSLG